MKVMIESGFYMCGTRWRVYYVDRTGCQQTLASGFKEEHDAKMVARMFERVYMAGAAQVDPCCDVWETGDGWIVDVIQDG